MVILHLFEYAASFVEVLVGIIVCTRLLCEKSIDVRKSILAAMFVALAIWALNQRVVFSFVITVVSITGIAISTWFLYKVPKADALIMAIFYMVLIYIVDFFTLSVAGMLLNEERMAQIIAGGYSPLRICVMLASKLLLIGTSMFMLKKVLIPVNMHIRKMWIGVVLAINVLYYLIHTTMAEINVGITMSWFFLLAFFVLAFYSVFQFFGHIREKQTWEMEREWNYMQMEAYNRLIQQYQENYAFYHDLKNQYLVLSDYIKKREYDKAEVYMSAMEIPVYGGLYETRTGIPTTDVLINYKIQEAISLGIRVESEIDLVNVCLTEPELTALLGNALDNAIEACQKMKSDDRWIMIRIHTRQEMTFIRISNSYEEHPVEECGDFLSTKKESRLHGHGLKSMRMIVEKYDGCMKTKYSDGEFTVSVSFFYVNDEAS